MAKIATWPFSTTELSSPSVAPATLACANFSIVEPQRRFKFALSAADTWFRDCQTVVYLRPDTRACCDKTYFHSSVARCPSLPRAGPIDRAYRLAKGDLVKWHPLRKQNFLIIHPEKKKAQMLTRFAVYYSSRRCAIMKSASPAWKKTSRKPSRLFAKTR